MESKHVAYISLGSNLGDPAANLACAREGLSKLPGILIDAASPVYLTEPQDYQDQPWFANQVLRILCAPDMTALTFLDMLQRLETHLGRVRASSPDSPAVRFGPRVIDLDLLLYDTDRYQTTHLTLPHPRLQERAFVLVPLGDIAPDLRFPDGRTPGETVRSLDHAVEGNRICQKHGTQESTSCGNG